MNYDALVLTERDRQDRKWGQQNHLSIEWMAILTEEVGELAQAIVDRHFSDKPDDGLKIQTELIHVAAVCKAMWECGERNRWWML